MSVNTVTYERPVENVLTRLQGVRQTGEGRWVALCPAHDDKHPSLSIAEAGDGRVLIHCQTGCPTPQVLAVLGLTWQDLFSGPLPGRGGGRRRLTREKGEAARRAQAEAELRRRLDAACDELHRRLCVYYRGINLALMDADLETYERLAGWVHALPFLEYLLNNLEAQDVATRLWAAREAARWLMV
ncbi:MAG: hypothetical protein AB1700_18060 [Bacillota bacterium]